MEKYISGDQVKIYFGDGSTVTAQVISDDDNNLECSALSKNEVYKEGDSIFVDKTNSKIEKLNSRDISNGIWIGELVKAKLNGREYMVLDVNGNKLLLADYNGSDELDDYDYPGRIHWMNADEFRKIPYKNEVDDDYGNEDDDFENQTFSKKSLSSTKGEVTIIPYMYNGFNYDKQKVWVDTKYKSPDPSKLMLWGYGEIDDPVSDYKRCFEKAGSGITLTYKIPPLTTHNSEMDIRAEAIRNYISGSKFSKKARTFNWEFDKHKPQWKLNKESMEIERDDSAIEKIAKLRNKLSSNSVSQIKNLIKGKKWKQIDWKYWNHDDVTSSVLNQLGNDKFAMIWSEYGVTLYVNNNKYEFNDVDEKTYDKLMKPYLKKFNY